MRGGAIAQFIALLNATLVYKTSNQMSTVKKYSFI